MKGKITNMGQNFWLFVKIVYLVGFERLIDISEGINVSYNVYVCLWIPIIWYIVIAIFGHILKKINGNETYGLI